MRRLFQEAVALFLRRQATESATQIHRAYSSLPEDIAQAARQARYPPRRQAPASPGETASSPIPSGAAAGIGTAASEAIKVQKEGAVIATNWMFPWERRQMTGGKLRSWEKLYWGVFVVAVSLLLFNRAREWKPEDDEAAKEALKEKEAKKLEKARLVLAGASMVEDEDDPFDGLTPEEVQKFVEAATGANSKDPFEGMTPEEINAYVQEHGLQ